MNADVHMLAGAYALDALPESERELFREHLQDCTACQQEVYELKSTTAQLGSAVYEQPPAALKTRVMEQVSRTRQQPPPLTEEPARARPRHRRRTLPMLAAAAALVLVALAGGFALNAWISDDAAPPDRIAAVLEADDAHAEQARLTGGGTLTMISSASQGRAVVTAEGLPPAGPDQTYQLWIIDDGEALPTQEFFDGGEGGQVRVVDDLAADRQVAITREPEGGSKTPSMAPLGVVSVTDA